MNGEEFRLIELVADCQNKKPIKISTTKSKLADIIKEGKNKFRKKYKFMVYCRAIEDGDGEDQYLHTDEDLRRVLQLHEGKLRFRLTNTTPHENDADTPVIIKQSHSVVFVIGNEDDTEDKAIGQLEHAGRLPGCIFAIGMPDLHAGKGIPIGATVMTQGVAFPQLVDNDIGCGMSFVQTSIQNGKLSTNKVRKIAERLQSIDCPYYASVEDAMEACSKPLQWGQRTLEPLPKLDRFHHYDKLGTVGGGNHFAELQEFDEIFDADTCARHGIDTEKVHMLVHSGSRSLGSQYLGEFCDEASKTMKSGPYPAETDSILFQEYLKNHDVAINFAARNRYMIATRLLKQLSPGDTTGPVCKIDITHNFLEYIEIDSHKELAKMAREQGLFPKQVPEIGQNRETNKETVGGWIHRKGATPTTQSDILVIPGSRGSLSYLVEINKRAHHGSAYSLAHGAGRKMARSTARARHQAQFPNPQRLLQTDLGGIVVCEEKDLVYEEAPASYKDIDRVVDCLASKIRMEGDETSLVRILATLRPILTYKYKDPKYGLNKCCSRI